MNVALNEAAAYMRKHNLRRNDTYLFVSTDSDSVMRKIKAIVKKTGDNFVYSVNDFKIGHSSTAKSGDRGIETWKKFYQRAIMDMFILKDSDYLIYSEGSSFGGISSQLQKTFDNQVSSDEFLKRKGLKCSVYSQRTKAGESFTILRSRGEKERTLRFNV